MAADRRLATIAEMIRKGDRVADIGSDHAYLPILLVKSGISPSAIACDVSDGPINNARANIERSGVFNVAVRKGDGLAAVSPYDADTFVIAGMGGDLIIKILSGCDWIKNSRYELILQPMTSAEDLRKYLTENGFPITEERAVTSAGRIYTIIKAVYSGVRTECDPLFYYVGMLPRNIGAQERKYISRKRRILAKLSDDISSIDTEKERYSRLLSVIEQMDRLLCEEE